MLSRVLDHYRLGTVRQIVPLGHGGGFSGAEFWRIQCDAGELCLRRWPDEHPDEPRLQAIHQFVQTASAHGLPVPAPLANRSGQGYVRQHRAWWELTPWMKGRADYLHDPSITKLQAALTLLAQCHEAVASIEPPREAPSPALKQRFQMLEQVPHWRQEISNAQTRLWPALRPAADEILSRAPRVAQALLHQMRDTLRLLTPIQWVIRDIWHDHVLFMDDEVTGVVDFGAISMDSVATDLSRLLGSLCADDWSQWEIGLAAYQSVRPLSNAEREQMIAMDRASVILSGLHWLRWIAVEGRSFDGRESEVQRRLETILQRLAHQG